MKRLTVFVTSVAATLALAREAASQTPPASASSTARDEPPAAGQAPAGEPPAYPPPSTRWKGIAVGFGATAFFYGLAAGSSYIWPDAPGTQDLRIPVVGPWLAIANNGCPADEPDCGPLLVIARSVLYVLDGVAQAGGLGIVLDSAFMPTQLRATTPARQTAPASAPPTDSPPPTTPKSNENKNLFFIPTPMTVGVRGIGLGVVGRF